MERPTSPPRDPSTRRPIGDRFEQALEDRADLEAGIDRSEAAPPQRGSLRRTAIWLAITAVSLYLVAPSLVQVLGSWDDVASIAPLWLVAMLVLQAISTFFMWALQRIALQTEDWFAVATSQVAGNGLSKIAPGGGAVGAALQYKMLVEAGLDRREAVAALTSTNLLTFGVVLALPVLALPAIATGAVSDSLVRTTLTGMAAFGLLLGIGAVLLASDRLLAGLGRAIQAVRNKLRRKAEPLCDLPKRLLRERTRILTSVGRRWKSALFFAVARWAFDYLTLLAALAAVGSRPAPGLVLLAFCSAQILAQIPVTPGGLGFVEAGLTATLALAGVSAGNAVLATFAYRLFSYWLPLPLGLVGMALHKRRYGSGRGSTPIATMHGAGP
jgi:uncharacterized protein (TIRG00374 family)